MLPDETSRRAQLCFTVDPSPKRLTYIRVEQLGLGRNTHNYQLSHEVMNEPTCWTLHDHFLPSYMNQPLKRVNFLLLNN